MARVNAFCEVQSDTRQVSVGGRSRNDSISAWLNTDTKNGTFAMRASVDVVGHGATAKERRKKEGDQREAHFKIELPAADESVLVRIVENGDGMRQLARIGATLVAIKGVIESDSDDPELQEHGAKCLEFSAETLAELEAEAGKNLPKVILPGGVTLAHALACVKMCEERLKAQESPAQN